MFIVGSNMPGYMPDSQPTDADSEQQAREMLEAEIVQSYESMFAPLLQEDHRDMEDYRRALEEARSADFSDLPIEVYYGDWVHWVCEEA